MKARSFAERRVVAIARLGRGAKVAALLAMAAGFLTLALLVAGLVPA